MAGRELKRLRARRTAGSAAAEPIVDVNTTPLIDVMLVLLVMLIITIPVQLHAVNLNLPVGPPPAADHKPEVVRIDIDAAGALHWNGQPLADAAELRQRLDAAATQALTPEIHVRPDQAARYDRFADVMVAADRAGLVKLGVVGSEQFVDE
ncbi:biopolymer transporter ExbD [Aquincola sp. S2]|uniref:Biopolymer transporter ExbD n=1 Tax=Pseudaquabacterium terrae TaxID=2732868 RepID=A0ABX2EPE7_9BURK|nr:biopolymer transporter ExbD [Aquabacterium terrae]NRF70575.1 biopolymer transporter ExbD [Aquabacterium terrae]